MNPKKGADDSVLHEDEVKRAADIREWLEGRILELETEVFKLRDMLIVVDSVLRKGSFVAATELRNIQDKKDLQTTQKPPPGSLKKPVQSVEKKAPAESANKVTEQMDQTRELRRSKDGLVMANAFIAPERVTIVPTSDVKLAQSTPPFQSFFVNRILKGFESKDTELAQSGLIEKNLAFSYDIEEVDGNISRVTIKNYREKSRLNEILNTISWAFSRMLEKK
ncbi:MAG: hypothetical protein ACYC7D_02990 [Nitrososphaerales archaeon]